MIKLLITDFDGTLVDTFEANFRAYQEAFNREGLILTTEKYRQCFGYRFERFMSTMGIHDDKLAKTIKEYKKETYPKYFGCLRPNKALIELIASAKLLGVKTAVASTARKENLINALNYLGLILHFDLILAGEDVINGKPSPEIYQKVMARFEMSPAETIIFEDSPVGIEAAKASGAHYMIIPNTQFE